MPDLMFNLLTDSLFGIDAGGAAPYRYRKFLRASAANNQPSSVPFNRISSMRGTPFWFSSQRSQFMRPAPIRPCETPISG